MATEIARREALTGAESRTYALALLGYSQTEIGSLEGISDRQVRNRVAKAKRLTQLPDVYAETVIGIFKLVPKALDILTKYLNGEGRQDGGDLKAALRILEATGALRSGAPANLHLEQRTTFQNTTNVNCVPKEYEGLSPEEIDAELEASSRRFIAYMEDKRRRGKTLASILRASSQP
jgi:hypothetical protein